MTRDAMPRVTVVTPVYNCAAYVGETIESLLAQTYANLDILVLDDGSTDGTLDMLRRFGDRIRVVSHPNMGEARSVNRGVVMAEGSVVGVVNADDPVLPTLVERAVAALTADPELVGVYPDWLKIDPDGQVIEEVQTLEFDHRLMVAQHFCIPGPGAFFRPSALGGEPVRDPEAGYSSDYDFWIRLGLKGRVQRLPEVLATWRFHADGASQAACTPAMAAQKVAVIERFFARPDLPAEMRLLHRQALSAACHSAAMVGLRGRGIPAFRYLLRSFLALPVWPRDVMPKQRRSLPHVAFLLTRPMSRYLLRRLAGVLPDRLRRRTNGLVAPPRKRSA